MNQSFSHLSMKGNGQNHNLKYQQNSETSPRSFIYQPPQMPLDPNLPKFKVNLASQGSLLNRQNEP
jgi:hypothetical protein